ncbi:hypothetical protein STRDD11_01647 [Streptococcus sp. DD11]|nr:hypothetical protein STRDD11_01647 [Streptococcus sp. DD11]
MVPLVPVFPLPLQSFFFELSGEEGLPLLSLSESPPEDEVVSETGLAPY